MSIALLSKSSYELQAAFNPIPVYLKRRDIAYTGTANYSGTVSFTVGVNLGLTIGSMIYIETLSGQSWTGWHEVSGMTSTEVKTTTAYVLGVSTGHLSSDEIYENYHVLIQIKDNRTDDDIVELKYSVDSTMEVYVNLSGIVRVLLGKDNDYGYHAAAVSCNVAEFDLNLMCEFSFRFKEGYLDDDESPAPEWSSNYTGFAVNAAMQLGENPNMEDWHAGKIGAGMFLTEFETITVFKGYPNSVTFIWLEGTPSSADYTLQRCQTFVAGGVSRETVEDLTPDYPDLPDNAVRVTIDDQSANERSGAIHIRSTDDESSPIYSTVINSLPLIYDDGICYDNPIYLCWLNTYGGFSYWLFHTTQEIKHEVFDQKEILHAVEDWASARTQEDVFEINARDKLVLGAQNITSDQLEGIKNMLHSPRVMLLLNAATFAEGDIPDWLTVSIQSGTFSFGSTGDSRHKVEFTIRKPRINIQQL